MSTIFGKIVKGEIPCDKVYENEHLIAFKDIAPHAPVHILIVPKKEIRNLQELKTEDLPLIGEVVLAVQHLARQFEIEKGYRLLTNNGSGAGQTVLHLHFHLIGGVPLSESLA